MLPNKVNDVSQQRLLRRSPASLVPTNVLRSVENVQVNQPVWENKHYQAGLNAKRVLEQRSPLINGGQSSSKFVEMQAAPAVNNNQNSAPAYVFKQMANMMVQMSERMVDTHLSIHQPISEQLKEIHSSVNRLENAIIVNGRKRSLDIGSKNGDAGNARKERKLAKFDGDATVQENSHSANVINPSNKSKEVKKEKLFGEDLSDFGLRMDGEDDNLYYEELTNAAPRVSSDNCKAAPLSSDDSETNNEHREFANKANSSKFRHYEGKNSNGKGHSGAGASSKKACSSNVLETPKLESVKQGFEHRKVRFSVGNSPNDIITRRYDEENSDSSDRENGKGCKVIPSARRFQNKKKRCYIDSDSSQSEC